MKLKAVIAKRPQRIVVRAPGRMPEPVQAPKSVQTSEPAQEPVRADLIAAAKIVASCPKSRLDTVISLLERSGIDMTDEEQSVIDDFSGKEAYEQVCNEPGRYIIEVEQMPLLTTGSEE